jgi:hypothetical protein
METVGNARLGDVGADLERLRSRVRADRRATSAPPIAFGVLVIVYAIVSQFAGALGPAGRHVTVLTFWPVVTAATLLGLWWWSRRRTQREGVGEGRTSYRTMTAGYLGALLVTVLLAIPVLFIGVAVPLVWPGAVLIAIGAWQRNRNLSRLGMGLVLVAVLEAVLAAFLRGSPPWSWIVSVAYALAGLALLAAGLVIRGHERTAS